MTYDELLEKLTNGENFTFTRYGDGEFGIMLNDPNIMRIVVNRHGDQQGIEIAGMQMLEGLDTISFMENDKYLVGIQGQAMRMFKKDIERLTQNVNICKADIIHHASQKERIPELIEVLKDKHVIVVGREYLKGLPFEFEHIVTPDNLVWRMTDYLTMAVREKIKNNSVVLWSASIASNICMLKCFEEDITQIDTGSVFDPYLYRATRKYHYDLKNLDL